MRLDAKNKIKCCSAAVQRTKDKGERIKVRGLRIEAEEEKSEEEGERLKE